MEPSTELRRLTTGSTTFFKSVFAPTWISGIGAFNVVLWMDLIGSPPAPLPVKIAILTLWLVFSPFFIWWSNRLRHVWFDGTDILLRSGQREHRIPLRDIREIKESRFQRVKLITLDLGRPTPLGDTVVFVAPFSFQAPFSDHPLVAELKERQRALRQGEPPRPRLP